MLDRTQPFVVGYEFLEALLKLPREGRGFRTLARVFDNSTLCFDRIQPIQTDLYDTPRRKLWQIGGFKNVPRHFAMILAVQG
jgi:hypothetical protein